MARERNILAAVIAVWLVLFITAGVLAYRWISERAQERAAVRLAEKQVFDQRVQRFLQEEQADQNPRSAPDQSPLSLPGRSAGDNQQAPRFSPDDQDNFPVPLTGPLPKPMPV